MKFIVFVLLMLPFLAFEVPAKENKRRDDTGTTDGDYNATASCKATWISHSREPDDPIWDCNRKMDEEFNVCIKASCTGDTKGKNCKSPYEGEEDLEVKEQACEAYETDPTDRSKVCYWRKNETFVGYYTCESFKSTMTCDACQPLS